MLPGDAVMVVAKQLMFKSDAGRHLLELMVWNKKLNVSVQC